MVRIFLVAFLMFIAGCNDYGTSIDHEATFRIKEKVWNESFENFNKTTLINSLEEIRNFHLRNSTGLQLGEPATTLELERAETYFGCKLPRELELLWSWRNGELTDKFIWYHSFLSIEESIKQHKSLIELDYRDWKGNWIPIFEFQGEWYGMPCEQTRNRAAPVIFYFVESGSVVAYTNLTKYMHFMARALDSTAVNWDQDWWDSDVKEMYNLYQELQAGSQFPYYAGQ